MADNNYLAPSLVEQGYTGVTGTTPYRPATSSQLEQLQSLYGTNFSGVIKRAPDGVTQLTLNFDGTQNNKDVIKPGEFITNIGNLNELLPANRANYLIGIGADGVIPGSIESNLQSTPFNAGPIGQAIVELAYQDLIEMVNRVREADPNAQIELNLTGFSRGGAEAVAFANLVNELGIPGVFAPGAVTINSLILFDPVDQTNGALNTSWPTNVRNSLVLVAMDETRSVFPPMAVGSDAIVLGVPGAHSDVGGSFGTTGISSVTLGIARNFLAASGVPISEVPSSQRPDWNQQTVHNSSIDNYGNVRFETSAGNRYYEGSGLGSISVQDMLSLPPGQRPTPVVENVNGRYSLVGWLRISTLDTTDPLTGERVVTRDVTQLARDGVTVTSRAFVSETRDSTGQLTSALNVTYSADGLRTLFTTLVERQVDGSLVSTSLDGQGVVQSTTITRVFDDGSSVATTQLANGVTRTTTRDNDNRITTVVEEAQVGISTVSTVKDGAGNLLETRSVQTFDDGSSIKDVTTPDGSVVHTVYDEASQVVSVTRTDAVLQNFGAAISDLNSLVQAIRSGQPLPILNSGLHLLNNATNPFVGGTQVINNQPLFTATAVVGAIGSLYGLYQAFSSDSSTLDKIYASANALVAVNTAYNVVSAQLAGEATVQALSGAVGGVAQALPFLGAAVALEKGDYLGAAVSIAAYFVPVIGWIYAAYSLITAIGSETPEAWGTARFQFADGTSITVDSAGEGIGVGKVTLLTQGNGQQPKNPDGSHNPNYFGGLLGYLNDVIAGAAQTNPNFQLGIIPQRLPQLTWHESRQSDPGYALVDIDPVTGQERYPALRYNDNFTPINADPTDPGQRRDVFERMVDSALARQAVAPVWEVRTARLQQDTGNPDAGLTEEERAANHGLSAPADASGNRVPGKFRPVVLDLNGDGTISTVTDAASNVSFDWDDTGYFKQTGWVGAGEGMLVLDRNFNGVADSGRELFSNGLVSDAAKGVRSMSWVDANADGVIDASDPVFAALSVWQDANQDGAQAASETHTLASLGITQLDYSNGRFTRNGQDYALQSPDLESTNDGARVNVVQGGIQVDYSNGRSTLFVTQVIDLGGGSGSGTGTGTGTIFFAHDDGFITWEDGISPGNPSDPAYPHAQTPTANQSISISLGLLLLNDAYNGSNAGLSVTAVGSGVRGAAVLNLAQGTVEFTPEHNYVGQASFEYTVTAADGQTRVAHALIDLQGVNDAPSIRTTTDQRSIYGYTPLNYSYTYYAYSGEDSVATTVSGTAKGDPIHVPYIEEIKGVPIYEQQFTGGEDGQWISVLVGYQPSTYVDRNMPIGTDDAGTGRVTAVDPDGASTFHYQLLEDGLYGKATIDATTGAWSYLGRRPAGVAIGDVDGNGTTDYVDPDNGTVYTAPTGNMDSNRYGGDEKNADGTNYFLDVFKVRVFDDAGGFTDQDVSVKHYGPRPLANVASGGGKKPIAVDLNGDSFHFTNVDDSNVFYDVNGDGWRRKIAWNNPADGFLAYDKNGDGKIDRFDEISFVPYKPDGQTDLEGLRAFDTNGDGVFSAADARWSSFGVWQDANSNGITDPGEFKSLNDLGINGISLTSDGQFQVIDGQTVHGVGSATKTDGSTLALADVTLQFRNVTQGTAPDGSTVTATVAPYSTGQTYTGTPDANLVFGTSGSDQYHMGDGNDVVNDDAGNDLVEAGAGDDIVFTGAGKDFIDAGDGKDSVFTGDGDDLAIGGAGDDFLSMGSSNDVAFGGDGNDLVSGGVGNDLLSGDEGDDQLFGEGGWDVLFGMAGDDKLWGGDGNDQLNGGTGHDWLAGGAGDDAMDGGSGNDTYEVDSVGDVVTEKAGEGFDTVRTSISYSLGADVENLTLTGSQALEGMGNVSDNVMFGNNASNTLRGLDGNDTLDGGQGADTLMGGTGDDTYVIDNADDVVIELAGEGVDTVNSRITTTLSGNLENLALIGINAINGTGNSLDNVITGNGAANRIDGGAGADRMAGGKGNDTYVVESAGDMVVEKALEGNDTVEASIDYALGANVENLILRGSATQGTGNELDNVLAANHLGNTLSGGAGSDILTGGAGADRLDGGTGADFMAGAAGDDTYVVDSTGDVVTEEAAQGTDMVESSISYALGGNVENLTFTGAANIDGAGNELANVLTGNSGDNRMDGGSGADTMTGGAGSDTYVVDASGDAVVENANEGIDTVLAGVNYVLGSNVENLTLRGNATQGTGNELANVITADDLGDALSGLAGDDTLVGGAGDDVLDGGTGADLMRGGKGDDLYVVDSVGDQVIESAADGTDTVQSSIDYALGANVENLTLTGSAVRGTGNELANLLIATDGGITLIGGAGDDTLIGGAGSDVLDGGGDADTMAGGAGEDSYVVDSSGDQVVELAGQGNDRVSASIDYALTQSVEQLTLTGSAIRGTGNQLDNVLLGNSFANVLDGGVGADTLMGGNGDDIYVMDSAGDLVIENAGEGNDTVQSSVTYALTIDVENMTLTGTAAIDATGNGLSNALTGNAGNNRLDGGTGADVMAGGSGDDSYIVDNAGDQVMELASQGFDRVSSSIDYVLPQYVEQLTLTGAASRAAGNSLDNLLFGSDLANILDGGNGADQMAGGLGDDLYVVDSAGDVVTEAANAGIDTVQSTVNYALAANVENLTLTGPSNVDATGNSLSNVLIGNTGNNWLDGGAGADVMIGDVGDDSYVVDNVGDQVIELTGQGIDRVSTGIDYVLPQYVEQITLTGAAIRATGNDLDNMLFGNDQANILDGKAGADLMSGGLGDDRYAIDNAGDVVTEAANAGIDTVWGWASYNLAANVENLVLTGTAAINGIGNELANVLVGNSGANALSAGAGNDVLAGGLGNDTLDGGAGDDLYLYNQGEGRDVIADGSGNDTLRFGAGITLDSVAARTVTVDGQSKVFISVLGADGTEQQDQGIELAASGGIERFEFASGTVATLSDLMVGARTLNGDYQNNTITGDRRDETIYSGAGDDIVYARTGNDIVYGGAGTDKLFSEGGNDKIYGESGNDQLWGGAGNDYLDGGSGNDQLVGGTGDDQLYGGVDSDVLDGGHGVDYLNGDSGEDQLFSGAGNDTLDGGVDADLLASADGDDIIHGGSGWNVVVAGVGNDAIDAGTGRDFIDAGAGNDTITTDSGSDFVAGGKGNDTMNTGSDHDLMAFNRGDGADIVLGSVWDRDTVSLGGGIRYTDLSLRKVGNDLVFDVAQGDSISFKDWYTSSARRSVDTLQMVTIGGDYSAASTDRMKNRKVVSFDFEQLANRFDTVRAANPDLTSWPVAGELNNYFKASSDTQAIGGDLAYRYGTTGSYGDLDWMGVRNQMAGMTGTAWQTLNTSTAVNPWTALQAGISLIADQTTGLPSPINPAASPSSDELIFAAICAGGNKPAWIGSLPAPVLP